MPLSNSAIVNAKPGLKPIRLFDEQGLYLEVSPAGGKWWRLKYRFDGKEKRLSLGVYPDVGLKAARERREQMRGLVADGVDPSHNRRATKLAQAHRDANSFEVVAREWLEKYSPTWAENHGSRMLRLFDRDLFPWMGERPISSITAPELLTVIRRIESRGPLETAHRALSNCSQVFRYGVATGRCERDPSGHLRGALPPVKVKHLAATTEAKAFAKILRAMDGHEGTLTVRCALRLAPLVFVHPGELRKAEWPDIDLDAAEWRYRVTKTDSDHIVPLSRQAVEILRELQPLTGSGHYAFPGARTGQDAHKAYLPCPTCNGEKMGRQATDCATATTGKTN